MTNKLQRWGSHVWRDRLNTFSTNTIQYCKMFFMCFSSILYWLFAFFFAGLLLLHKVILRISVWLLRFKKKKKSRIIQEVKVKDCAWCGIKSTRRSVLKEFGRISIHQNNYAFSVHLSRNTCCVENSLPAEFWALSWSEIQVLSNVLPVSENKENQTEADQNRFQSFNRFTRFLSGSVQDLVLCYD